MKFWHLLVAVLLIWVLMAFALDTVFKQVVEPIQPGIHKVEKWLTQP